MTAALERAVRNRLELDAVLLERGVLRYTPAGIAMLDARLAHRSQQAQLGPADRATAQRSRSAQQAPGSKGPGGQAPRQVEFEMAALFAGELADRAGMLAVGSEVAVSGFLAPRRAGSKALVLHVTRLAIDPLARPDQAIEDSIET